MLIERLLRRRVYPLSLRQVLIFFAAKIAGGCTYGYLFKKYYGGDDTWGFNEDGILQYKRLLHTPGLFFTDVFNRWPVPADEAYYFHPIVRMESLEYALFTKLLAFFNCVTQGNYYLNVVFFNLISFAGIYLLYTVAAPFIGRSHQRVAAAVLFLFPPALFWLSGIRAEGLLILLSGISMVTFRSLLNKVTATALFLFLGSLALTLIFRDAVAALLLPALLAWGISVRCRYNPERTFAAVFGILFMVIAATAWSPWHTSNIPALVAERQHAFMTLVGNTRFNLTRLEATPLSFLRVTPEALLNTFVRPFPWEARGPLQLFATVENLVVLLIFVYAGLACPRKKYSPQQRELIALFLVLAVTNYLLIGYTVPFPGAIVRYKIIPEEWLLAAALLLLCGSTRPDDQLTTASRQI